MDQPMFALSEEHRAVRQTVRAVAEAKIAPYAAAVDREARFPQEAHDALLALDLHAPHVPEEYGGAGADALATCLVIEEVARVDVSASLIPAVNKLGSLPLQLAGDDAIKKRYLTRLAAGEGGFSCCLSEPEAGSDAGAMRTRAVRDGDSYVLDGVKRWITNAGVSEYYTVLGVTDPASASRWTGSSARRAVASSTPCAPWTTPASPSPPRRSASPKARSTTRWATPGNASSSAARSPTSRGCSSSSPIWA